MPVPDQNLVAVSTTLLVSFADDIARIDIFTALMFLQWVVRSTW